MATLLVKDARKSYGSAEVIHGVDMDIEDGEFVVLVGPSGCGKSTLLRMIAGLEDISGGQVAIGGRVVNNLSPKERNIAMVFQNYALYPQMTVEQNLGFSLEISGVSKTEIRTKVENAADILSLTPLLARKPSQLSGGQRQRVAMGRAIVRDPDVFLFDEPLSNLDAKLRVQMRAEIKALHQRLGSTIVYVTHDQIEAMTMADKIVVLNGGRVEQIGAPLELYDNPKNMFVAGFLGSPSMNFFRVEAANDGLMLPSADVISSGSRKGLSGNYVLGVRPEMLQVDPKGKINAKVDVFEPTGAETLLSVYVGEELATIVVNGRVDVSPGDMIKLSVKEDNIHLFDPESELAV